MYPVPVFGRRRPAGAQPPPLPFKNRIPRLLLIFYNSIRVHSKVVAKKKKEKEKEKEKEEMKEAKAKVKKKRKRKRKRTSYLN